MIEYEGIGIILRFRSISHLMEVETGCFDLILRIIPIETTDFLIDTPPCRIDNLSKSVSTRFRILDRMVKAWFSLYEPEEEARRYVIVLAFAIYCLLIFCHKCISIFRIEELFRFRKFTIRIGGERVVHFFIFREWWKSSFHVSFCRSFATFIRREISCIDHIIGACWGETRVHHGAISFFFFLCIGFCIVDDSHGVAIIYADIFSRFGIVSGLWKGFPCTDACSLFSSEYFYFSDSWREYITDSYMMIDTFMRSEIHSQCLSCLERITRDTRIRASRIIE